MGIRAGVARRGAATVVVVLSILAFSAQPAAANEAQRRIVNAGRSLGEAAARESVFGEIHEAGVPPGQIAAIATNLANATAEMIAAEAEFEEPFATERNAGGVLVGLTSRIAAHPEVPRPANPRHMERMLHGIFHSYREGLALTFDSRQNSYDHRPTCDSLFLTAGYYCGVATIVSTVGPPHRRTGFRASARQSDANQQIRSAVQLGLEIALDGSPRWESQKVACSFGEPELWDALPLQSLQPDSPTALYEELCTSISDIALHAGLPAGHSQRPRSPATRPHQTTAEKWGAFAASSSRPQKWGSAWNYSEQKEAEASALGNCEKLAGDCKVWSFSGCAAFAAVADGAWSFRSQPGITETSIEAARSAALDSCRSRDPSCELERTLCADGSERWQRERTSSRWGAFAASSSQPQKWGSAWNYPEQEEAEATALGNCRNLAGDCKVWSFSGCAAFAAVADGAWSFRSKAGITEASIEAARSAALDSCRDRDASCDLERTLCADGSRRWQREARKKRSVHALEVLAYHPGNPQPESDFRKPDRALGPPDWDGQNFGSGFVSLGCGGSLALGFFTTGGMTVETVRIHEIGSAVEPTAIEVRTTSGWVSLGEVSGRTQSIEVEPAREISAVRLRDLGSECNQRTPGADIDAVELIGW